MQVLRDNISGTYIIVNLVFYDRSKYSKVDYHFVCEWGSRGDLVVSYVPIQLQLMNIFTKSLHVK